jgi:glutamyl-tRNA reductase
MQLSLVGINNQTAPVSIREKVAVNGEGLSDYLLLLRSYIDQGVILSTCNRTEVYTITNGNVARSEAAIFCFMKTRLDVPDEELHKYIYTLHGIEAAQHLFRLTSGLESLIVGEYEIQGQVKQALEAAERNKMADLLLRQAFYSAIKTGRRVRQETGISKNALSVSSVAVELATNVTGDLTKCKVLVIGAGEAGRLVAKVAKERGASKIIIANRTKERAQRLAATLNGIPVDLSNLDSELKNANIVVTCAGAPHHILNSDKIKHVMNNRPTLPMVIIDIGIPRNVEPKVAKIPNVYLHNIDDLTEIANLNRQSRVNEIHRAEMIVSDEIERLMQSMNYFKIRPLVGALMGRAEEVRQAQLNKTLKKLPPLSDEQRESLEAMTKSIVTGIIKDPIQYLRTNSSSHDAEMVNHIFNLNM